MPIDVRHFDIPADQWATAWALHVTADAAGTLHVNIDEFAVSVGVPLDAPALEALIACLRVFAEQTYGRALPVDYVTTSAARTPQH